MFVFNVAAPGSATVHAPNSEFVQNDQICWPKCRAIHNNARNTRFVQVENPVNCRNCLTLIAQEKAATADRDRLNALTALIHPKAVHLVRTEAERYERQAVADTNRAGEMQKSGHHGTAHTLIRDSDEHAALAESLHTIANMAAAVVAAEQARR